MKSTRQKREVQCASLICPDCGAKLILQNKPAGWHGGGKFVYLCQNWPRCRGLLSAHPDGRPCGKPADAYTRNARKIVHELFDPLWRNDKSKPRQKARIDAYSWLSAHCGIPKKECHISMMDLPQLRQVWRVIKQNSPTPESIEEWVNASKGSRNDRP